MNNTNQNQEELNVFDAATPPQGEFAQFKEVGDSVQGTYIDRREGVDGFGNEQVIYVLKDKEGNIWNVGIKKTNPVTQAQMESATFGRIVGFRLDEIKKSKRPGLNDAKYINAYHDKNIVDTEWLKQREALEKRAGNTGEAPQSQPSAGQQATPAPEKVDAPVTAAPVEAAVPDTGGSQDPKQDSDSPVEDPVVVSIRNIALDRGLVQAGTDPQAIDSAITAYTELEYSAENYPAIISKLSTYSPK